MSEDVPRGPRRFGAVIRQARLNAGLTQRELATAIDLDFSYVSKIENGKLPVPSERTIVRMCDVLHLEFLEVMNDAGKLPKAVREWFVSSTDAQAAVLEMYRKSQEAVVMQQETGRRDARNEWEQAHLSHQRWRDGEGNVFCSCGVGFSMGDGREHPVNGWRKSGPAPCTHPATEHVRRHDGGREKVCIQCGERLW